MITRPCQDLDAHLLKEEIRALRASVNRLHQTRQPFRPVVETAGTREADARGDGKAVQLDSLISRILDYLHRQYADSDLSLVRVAKAVGKNEKYVAHLFARTIGERMRTYITRLRVRHACELLLQTDRAIQEIARESGFAHSAHFRQSFRRIVGVAASEYRGIFAPQK
ncbi:MAG: helix-turn-helix transcriptional regulator [Candidatus Eisenbacteria bacterium]|nr:helix-turn-helix transcriptional regulator [Candidatus Eisenbacteria bacterium]